MRGAADNTAQIGNTRNWYQIKTCTIGAKEKQWVVLVHTWQQPCKGCCTQPVPFPECILHSHYLYYWKLYCPHTPDTITATCYSHGHHHTPCEYQQDNKQGLGAHFHLPGPSLWQARTVTPGHRAGVTSKLPQFTFPRFPQLLIHCLAPKRGWTAGHKLNWTAIQHYIML